MFFEISERSHQEIQYNSKSSSKCVHMNKDFKAPRCGYFSRNYIFKKKKKKVNECDSLPQMTAVKVWGYKTCVDVL